jgi:V/A-type H+-transporting ATPase subunit C
MVIRVDFEYVNARVRGMKSRLLSTSVLESLILKPDVESIIAVLENTAYKEEIERASVQYSGLMCIEVALRQNFTNAFRKIFNMGRGREYREVCKSFAEPVGCPEHQDDPAGKECPYDTGGDSGVPGPGRGA